jgi:hypothetical protein
MGGAPEGGPGPGPDSGPNLCEESLGELRGRVGHLAASDSASLLSRYHYPDHWT